ncbi:MAG TPA: choice-of-anchor tandem repeat GloVer-containing protein [Terriglobales bacterium]
MRQTQARRRTPLLLVFMMLALLSSALAGQYRILHAFGTGEDGAGVWGSLAIDEHGNLYGTTEGGGGTCCGIAFQLTPQPDGRWTENILYDFNCKVGGCQPFAGLVADPAGNLYGMANTDVFELTPGQSGWTISVLNDQQGGTESLLLDQAGNLYASLGAGEYNQGAISELVKDQNWTENWLYSFCSENSRQRRCMDGTDALSALTWGPDGALYGTTKHGGNPQYNSPNCGIIGCGVVYQLSPQADGTWKENVLHSFPAFESDGYTLFDSVILDKSGNVYGATAQGGTKNCGSIFKLTHEVTGWKETILHECGSNNLIFDANGNLWGTTPGGGKYGYGTVFELSPQKSGKWKYTVVHQFNGADGASPNAAVTFDEQGNLYGTTVLGGPGNSVGVVFEITTTPSPQ